MSATLYKSRSMQSPSSVIISTVSQHECTAVIVFINNVRSKAQSIEISHDHRRRAAKGGQVSGRSIASARLFSGLTQRSGAGLPTSSGVKRSVSLYRSRPIPGQTCVTFCWLLLTYWSISRRKSRPLACHGPILVSAWNLLSVLSSVELLPVADIRFLSALFLFWWLGHRIMRSVCLG